MRARRRSGAFAALFLLALAAGARRACAGALRLEAYDAEGRPLSAAGLLAYIAPESKKAGLAPAESAILLQDLDDTPMAGRPWYVADSSEPALVWEGASRVVISLPWPVRSDGFSTVLLDNGGTGYADGDRVFLNEAIAQTQYRLFKESLQERLASWEPNYRPSRSSRELQRKAQAAMAAAQGESVPSHRAALYEKALPILSAAWAKMLFEHGAQTVAHPRLGPALRWGLTLDESLASRVSEFEAIARRLKGSGANWVRLVFRANPNDFLYASPRSFMEYDSAVAELTRHKLHVMGSVLDSTMWPRTLEPQHLAQRTRNIVMHFKNTIRSWEVASEPNGDWLGGYRSPLPEEIIVKSIREAAAEVKRIDGSLETVATLYWWDGTAKDDRRPTFAWLRRAVPQGVFSQIDVVGLSVYPDDNPMGMAFDTVFRRLHRYFPDKRLMLGGFGYVEGSELKGYWWLDPADLDGARKDLLILYTGAAAATHRPAGGGFWWPTLGTMLSDSRDGESLYRIYRRTLDKLGR